MMRFRAFRFAASTELIAKPTTLNKRHMDKAIESSVGGVTVSPKDTNLDGLNTRGPAGAPSWARGVEMFLRRRCHEQYYRYGVWRRMQHSLAHQIYHGSQFSCPKKKTMVMMHGILGSKVNWKTFARRLLRAHPDWQVILVDHRGMCYIRLCDEKISYNFS